MSLYTKPHLKYVEQLELLKGRGLLVNNEEEALGYLQRLGYYRLSGYLYPFREHVSKIDTQNQTAARNDFFIPGSSFEDAINLYIFDKKLRLLIIDAVERVEVAIRVDVAYLLGSYDTFAHKKPELLHGNFTKKVSLKTGTTKYEDWISKHENQVKRSKEDFVYHFKKKYGLPLPIWVAIELWDFGLLSHFFSGMKVKDKITISKKYQIEEHQILQSWLRSINYVRNVAAHHSRLWNRNIIDQPKLPKEQPITVLEHLKGHAHCIARIYSLLCILKHLLNTICPRNSWSNSLINLISEFPSSEFISIEEMGFPHNWLKQELWK